MHALRARNLPSPPVSVKPIPASWMGTRKCRSPLLLHSSPSSGKRETRWRLQRLDSFDYIRTGFATNFKESRSNISSRIATGRGQAFLPTVSILLSEHLCESFLRYRAVIYEQGLAPYHELTSVHICDSSLGRDFRP